MVNSREKGARGEREFCKQLGKRLNMSWLRRNLSQYQTKNLHDILTSPPEGTEPDTRQQKVIKHLAQMAIEVKRYKSVTPGLIKQWFGQACQQAESCSPPRIPILAYRVDHGLWQIMVPAYPSDFSTEHCYTMGIELFAHILVSENLSGLAA